MQNNTRILVGALLFVCAMPPFAAHAQLVGTDNVPGTACSAKGSVQMTANATGPGAYILTCDGDAPTGKWVATINAELPTANAQVANKEYVDSAVAAGSLAVCTNDYASLCALETNRGGNDPQFTAANIASGINILGVTGTMTGAAPDCVNDSSVTCTLESTRSNADAQFIAGNIRTGINILNVTGSLPNCANDSTVECILPATRSSGDAQFVASNIANGVNVLGVTGTLTGGLSGPSGCANIGDLCADGTVFAGYHPITQEHLFIPTTDQGTTSAWKTSTGVNDIAADSTYDGRANTNQVANSTTFPAFKLCKDLAVGGYSDWYLPSQVELYYLWSVRTTIEAGGNITNFQNANYWSSTELDTSNAWFQFFPGGGQSYVTKTFARRVRCVRR